MGRADVWVFDADHLGAGLSGTPETILTLFTDTPRALAASPDGSRVYAAGFHSGNKTASLEGLYVTDGGPAAPDGFGLAAPTTNFQGLTQPEEGMILQHDGEHWRDPATGRDFDHLMRFNLPDKDVFALDALADPPVQLPGGAYSGVGTVLFNMAVNPVSGKVYVSNTEARNDLRFEGPGDFAGVTLRGHLAESRITVIDGTQVLPRHLNKHIDYDDCCDNLPNSVNARSLAQPVEMTVSSDGTTLYVAAFGSAKIGVFATAALENDTFVPDAASHIALSGGGPSGLVLDEENGRLYALTRFDNTVTVIDTATRQEIARRPLFNPEPAHVVAGRPFLYDARLSSSNGEASCASCHIFGDLDSLAWNLGNPDEEPLENPGPFLDDDEPFPGAQTFQPLKGPMTTQSLRGMANHGPMHWRGDRNGNNEVAASAQPDTGIFDEVQAFREFNPAFEGLLGGPRQLTPAEMAAFTEFILEVTYPPNPIRSLDNSLTPGQVNGRQHFFNALSTPRNPAIPTSAPTTCQSCHTLDPQGNAEFGVAKPGFFGSRGLGVTEPTAFQHLEAAHFRNLYQKVGMFGLAPTPPGILTPHSDFSHQGDQIRGFGYLHNGAIDSVFRFLSSIAFSEFAAPDGFPFSPAGDPARREVESFLLAFDSNMAPIVGQQVTLNRHNGAGVGSRIDLLIQRAAASPAECELVAHTRQGSREQSWLYLAAHGSFRPNEHGKPSLSDAQLRHKAQQAPLTYTCVPVGSGQRIGLDADLDGCFDVTEEKAGFDPRDPDSRPQHCF